MDFWRGRLGGASPYVSKVYVLVNFQRKPFENPKHFLRLRRAWKIRGAILPSASPYVSKPVCFKNAVVEQTGLCRRGPEPATQPPTQGTHGRSTGNQRRRGRDTPPPPPHTADSATHLEGFRFYIFIFLFVRTAASVASPHNTISFIVWLKTNTIFQIRTKIRPCLGRIWR